MSIFNLLFGCFSNKREKPRKKETRQQRKQRTKAAKTALTVFDADNANNPFTSFHLETWMEITSYLKCNDVMNLRLASLGIPRAITLNPALTSHLALNLDKCPWEDWVYKNRVDHVHLARIWCHRSGVILFPSNISNEEMEVFISKDYLCRAQRVSFGRCRNLSGENWFRLLKEIRHLECIEVALPNTITDSELGNIIQYLQYATRLNCVGCSQLSGAGFGLLGRLRDLKELYFLHWYVNLNMTIFVCWFHRAVLFLISIYFVSTLLR